MDRPIPPSVRARLKAHAVPTCPECDGEGVINVTYNSRPDTGVDVACECVGPVEEERE